MLPHKTEISKQKIKYAAIIVNYCCGPMLLFIWLRILNRSSLFKPDSFMTHRIKSILFSLSKNQRFCKKVKTSDLILSFTIESAIIISASSDFRLRQLTFTRFGKESLISFERILTPHLYHKNISGLLARSQLKAVTPTAFFFVSIKVTFSKYL